MSEGFTKFPMPVNPARARVATTAPVGPDKRQLDRRRGGIRDRRFSAVRLDNPDSGCQSRRL